MTDNFKSKILTIRHRSVACVLGESFSFTPLSLGESCILDTLDHNNNMISYLLLIERIMLDKAARARSIARADNGMAWSCWTQMPRRDLVTSTKTERGAVPEQTYKAF